MPTELMTAPLQHITSPTGPTIIGRYRTAGSYRYGFQGQEQDNELWQGAVSFKYRIEDARLGRFFSVDPLYRKFAFYSPFHFGSNSPIMSMELEGLESSTTGTNCVENLPDKAKQKTERDFQLPSDGSGDYDEASYVATFKSTKDQFNKLMEAYSTNPGLVQNNIHATYHTIESQTDDDCKLDVGDQIFIELGAVDITRDSYVQLTSVTLSENEFQICATTLSWHVDAGHVQFAGKYDEASGLLTFSICNQSRVANGFNSFWTFGADREWQREQWGIVLANVGTYIGTSPISSEAVINSYDWGGSDQNPVGDLTQWLHIDYVEMSWEEVRVLLGIPESAAGRVNPGTMELKEY